MAKSPNIINNRSYSLALDIDERLQKEYGHPISSEDFRRITRILQYPQTRIGQDKFFTVLNRLSPSQLTEKVSQVFVLVDLLARIQKNKR